MRIHVWVPDYSSSMGGIQTLSRFVVRALHDCLPNAEISVFAKNDTSIPEDNSVAHFRAVGSWPRWQRTAAFTLQLWHNAYLDRPDLIIVAHAHFAPVAHWLQKLFGIPFITIGNGIEVWDIPNSKVRRALRASNKLIAISEYTRDRMASALHLPSDLITVFPCTFDEDQFQPGPKPNFLLKRYGLRRDQPVILTIARLASAERYKGYDQLLQALTAVKEAFPDVRYVLGGRGPDRSRVAALIRKLGIGDVVILPGYVPQHELSAHYNLCDVFAMPSKGEGFGIVFLEAIGCGKPVIAGNKDGSVDAVLNGRVGVLVDPDSVNEIAAALIKALSESSSPAALGVRSAERSDHVAFIREPELRRREMVAAYGYKRFKQRLSEILEPLLKS